MSCARNLTQFLFISQALYIVNESAMRNRLYTVVLEFLVIMNVRVLSRINTQHPHENLSHRKIKNVKYFENCQNFILKVQVVKMKVAVRSMA